MQTRLNKKSNGVNSDILLNAKQIEDLMSDLAGISSGSPNTLIDNTNVNIIYSGTWSSGSDVNYYNGTKHTSNTINAYIQYTFTGTGIEIYDTTSSNRGIIEVFIDDISKGTFDRYSASTTYRQLLYSISNLSKGEHTVKIVITGMKHTSSTDYYIGFDYFNVINNHSISSMNNLLLVGNIRNWGAIPTEEITGFNSTTAIKKCYEYCVANNRDIFFPEGTYLFDYTFSITGSIKITGAGYNKTYLKRLTNKRVFEVIGQSILNPDVGLPDIGLRHIKNITLDGFTILGNDFDANIMHFECCDCVLANNIKVYGTTGTAIYGLEFYDSKFTNVDLEWCGSSSNLEKSAVIMESSKNMGTWSYEYTNNIHFNACRWETYRGTAVYLKGTDTNKIHFNAVKIESGVTNTIPFIADGSNKVYFARCVIAMKGTQGTTIPCMLKLLNCNGVYGDVNFEIIATGTRATFTNFVYTDNTTNIDMDFILGVLASELTDTYIMKVNSTPDSNTICAKGYFEASGSNKVVSNINTTRVRGKLQCYDGLYLEQASTANTPAGVNGGMYYNSDNHRFRGYVNGAWRSLITCVSLVGSGANVSVTSGTTYVDITGLTETDTGYGITVTPYWNTSYWISNKATTGFRINFGTAPSGNSTIDWGVRK